MISAEQPATIWSSSSLMLIGGPAIRTVSTDALQPETTRTSIHSLPSMYDLTLESPNEAFMGVHQVRPISSLHLYRIPVELQISGHLFGMHARSGALLPTVAI